MRGIIAMIAAAAVDDQLPHCAHFRITSYFQQCHEKKAAILLGDASLAEPSVSSHQVLRAGGLIHQQQRAATASETCKLRRR
jgi:hypothetical protein